MWIDDALQTIDDAAQYVGPDGTLYPWNFPKSEIPGLSPVIMTAAPVVGEHQSVIDAGIAKNADGAWEQQWQIVNWTDAQIAADDQQKAAAELASMAEYLATVRDMRERILNRLAGIGVRALVANDMTLAGAISTSAQQLLDMTKDAAVVAATTRASLETAVKTVYAGIVMATPDTLRNAFYQVDE